MAKKWLISAENYGFSARLSKTEIHVCYHKTQLLSVLTYPLTIKINPDNTVNANVSVSPPPPWMFIFKSSRMYACLLIEILRIYFAHCIGNND